MSEPTAEIARHEHCDEGACESCDCCCAGWCINFEDGSPWDDALGRFKCITPFPMPGSPSYEHAVEEFETWCAIALESRGFDPAITPDLCTRKCSPGNADPACSVHTASPAPASREESDDA